MGCDIHAGIEYKNGTKKWAALLSPNKHYGQWKDEPKMTARLCLNRNYNTFSILANVRNGYGFAGCKTGEGFVPMSDNRGFPEDISTESMELACTGDHSETWVNLQDILDYDWDQVATLTGVVTAIEFERWDRMKQWDAGPESYCGDRSGLGIKNITEDAMRDHIKATIGETRGREYEEALKRLDDRLQTRISWRKTYAECAPEMWTKILPPMLKLGNAHGYANVRLVMNFDS